MSYRFGGIFLDLDDTILDFHRSEKESISKTLAGFGIEPTENVTQLYSLINDAQWKLLEKGRLTRAQVLTRRFSLLFETLAVPLSDPAEVWKTYEGHLSRSAYLMPGAAEAVAELKKEHRVFVATNGTVTVQRGRLALCGIEDLFDGVFISQETGFNKPSPEFFRFMAEKTGIPASDSVMIGDSLTSDIAGGIAAGMMTVHLMTRPAAYPPEITPDMTVTDVRGIPGAVRILENKRERSAR